MKENYKLVKEAHQDLPFIEVAKKVQAQYNELGDAERAVRNNCCILAPLLCRRLFLPHFWCAILTVVLFAVSSQELEKECEADRERYAKEMVAYDKVCEPRDLCCSVN